MRDLLSKLRDILTKRDRRRFKWVFVFVLLMGFFEVIGIASIFPFMQLVANPETIEESRWIGWIYDKLGFQSERSFLLMMGGTVLVLLAMSNGIIVVTRWVQAKTVWTAIHSLAQRLLEIYLFQPYEFFLNRNSADLSKQVLDEVNQLANSVLTPAIQAFARVIVSLAIISLLVAVDPTLAITIVLVLGGVYSILYYSLRGHLKRLGQSRFDANRSRFRTAREAFSGIKAVKIKGREQFFADRFVSASRIYTKVQPQFAIASIAPVYLVQTLAFGGILTVVLYLLTVERDVEAVLPMLSLYALAGYRLMPSLQQIYNSIATIRYNLPVIDGLHADLMMAKTARRPKDLESMPELRFSEQIEIRNLTYRYRGADSIVLEKISVVIPAKSSVAFVGPTGSGKTTLFDSVVGLLHPAQGGVLVDGVPITDQNIRSWQNMIGYVPQDVTLYDASISRNIVFGHAEIDLARLHSAAKIANIHDFIVNELPEGYETFVGEQGIRLSGGQRQRIGLARALYFFPKVLVLDEATSALDGITEEAIMHSIREASESITLIMIAHRLDTVKDCDIIYLLDEGQIVNNGTYEELIESSSIFRGMAKVTTD